MTEIIRIELLQPEQHPDLTRLSGMPGVLTARVDDSDLVIEMGRTSKTLLDVLQTVEESSIPYGQVYCARPTLNTVFLEITGKALRDS